MAGKYKPRNNYDQKPVKWKYPPMYNDAEDSTDQWQMGDVQSLESGDPMIDQDARPNPEDERETAIATKGGKMKKLRKSGMPEK